MEPASAALSAAAKLIADLARDGIKYGLTRVGADTPLCFPDQVEYHLGEVASWSSIIQSLDMSSPEATDYATVPLSLDVPRRFINLHSDKGTKQETDLLQGDSHYIILGHPGSGKTTALKRLSRHLLTSAEESDQDRFQYPVVVRLREIDTDSLYPVIASHLGLQCNMPPREQADSAVYDLRPHIGKLPAEKVVSAILNETRAVLLLDGLDEIRSESRPKIQAEIKNLRWHLQDSKLIVTCRSGDLIDALEGFTLLELCPLRPEQIEYIAERWLGEQGKKFVQALKILPYSDVTDRPLLLTQLLLLYKSNGYLPNRPSDVYRKVLRLMLEEWDVRRSILRYSRYATFTPDEKLLFLSAIAYQLTCKIKSKVFDEQLLKIAYYNVHQSFNLPSREGELVVQELETHTGIIAATATGYEFSHLSLQEYLCAEYLVRAPYPELLSEYILEYPAPLAVCISLSSDPSSWFAILILKDENWESFRAQSLGTFLARLRSEKPFFQRSIALGIAILRLIDYCVPNEVLKGDVQAFADIEVVAFSIAAAFEFYFVSQHTHGDRILCFRRSSFKNNFGFTTPYRLELPLALIHKFLGMGVAVEFRTPYEQNIATTVEAFEKLRDDAAKKSAEMKEKNKIGYS